MYYAGAYVRDLLRRKKSPNQTVDILIRGISFDDLVNKLRSYGLVVEADRRMGRLRIRNHVSIQIDLPKKEGEYNPNFALKDDARERIFTVNAMYLPMSTKRKRGVVVDMFNGNHCIKDKKVQTVGKAEKLIKQDPSVIAEAFILASELGYKLDGNLFHAIKVHCKKINEVSSFLLRKMVVTVVMSQKPSKYIKMLHDTGVLAEVLPELDLCYGVKQNVKYHKYDVFTHCVMACDAAEPDLLIRLGALLHDIGKVQSRHEIIKDGKPAVTFYNHEVIGFKLAKRLLRRLGFNEEKVVMPVSKLVRRHMYNYDPIKWTDAAVRRFIRKMEITEEDLKTLDTFPVFLVRKADRAASGNDLSEISPRQKAFEERIKTLYSQMHEFTIADLDIDGSALMSEFKLREGPTIGHILNHLLSLVVENQIPNDKEALVEEASKYLSNALK